MMNSSDFGNPQMFPLGPPAYESNVSPNYKRIKYRHFCIFIFVCYTVFVHNSVCVCVCYVLYVFPTHWIVIMLLPSLKCFISRLLSYIWPKNYKSNDICTIHQLYFVFSAVNIVPPLSTVVVESYWVHLRKHFLCCFQFLLHFILEACDWFPTF